jgi:hypothetical protein
LSGGIYFEDFIAASTYPFSRDIRIRMSLQSIFTGYGRSIKSG